jgi:hypothetical protein
MQAIWFFLVVGVLSYLVMVREKYAPGIGGCTNANAAAAIVYKK